MPTLPGIAELPPLVEPGQGYLPGGFGLDALDLTTGQQQQSMPLSFGVGSMPLSIPTEALLQPGGAQAAAFAKELTGLGRPGGLAKELGTLPGLAQMPELELATIKYSLFGEKMRNASSTYWFNPEKLTLASAPDGRVDLGLRVETPPPLPGFGGATG